MNLEPRLALLATLTVVLTNLGAYGPARAQTCTDVVERGGYWFEEPDAADPAEHAGGGGDLTPTGTEVAIGRVGSARRFDGVDDAMTYVHQYCGPGCTGPFPVNWDLWVRPEGTTGVLLSLTWNIGEVRLEMLPGSLQLTVDDGFSVEVLTAPALPLGAWSHVAFAYEPAPDVLRLYVDGMQADSVSPDTPLSIQGVDGFVVGNDGGGSAPFAGKIDELQQIGSFDTADAAAIHAAGGAGKCPPPPDWEVVGNAGSAFDVAVTAPDGSGNEQIYSFGIVHSRFDGTTSTAIEASPTPGRVNIAAALGADGHIYTVGGDKHDSVNGGRILFYQTDRYDPETDDWSALDTEIIGFGSFPTDITQATAVALSHTGGVPGSGDYVYLIGGAEDASNPPAYASSGPYNTTTYRLDLGALGSGWVAMPSQYDAPGPMVHWDAAVDCDGVVYLTNGGGLRSFDPTAATPWNTSLPAPPETHALGAWTAGNDGLMYLINGDQLCPTTAVDVFDPASETWLPPGTAPPTSTTYFGLSAARLGDRIYAFGGLTHGSCGVNANVARELAGFPYCSTCNLGTCSEECAVHWRGEDMGDFAVDSNWSPQILPTPEKAVLENASGVSNESVLGTSDGIATCGARIEGTPSAPQLSTILGALSTAGGTEVNAYGELGLAGGDVDGGVSVAPDGFVYGDGHVDAISSAGLVQAANGETIVIDEDLENQPGGLLELLGGNLESTSSDSTCAATDGLVNHGEVDLDSEWETVNLDVNVFNLAGGLITMRPGPVQLAPSRRFENFGTVVIEPASVLVHAGGCPLVNHPGGTWISNGLCFPGPCPSAIVPPTMTLLDDMVSAQGSSLLLGDSELAVFGSLEIGIDDPTRLDASGSVQVFGTAGGSTLEVLAADDGATKNLPAPASFSLGTLHLSNAGGPVQLVDDHANAGGGEVLYVESLEIDATVTLDLAGQTIYYERVTPPDPFAPGSGVTITDSVGGGSLTQLSPEVVACGNGIDDDGDAQIDHPADDGCYSVEDPDEATGHLVLGGTAQGGSIEVVVSGYLVRIETAAGESAAQVAARLADAIGAHTSLGNLGVGTNVVGADVQTDGSYQSVAIDDPGLSDVSQAPLVPVLPWGGAALLALGITLLGRLRLPFAPQRARR